MFFLLDLPGDYVSVHDSMHVSTRERAEAAWRSHETEEPEKQQIEERTYVGHTEAINPNHAINALKESKFMFMSLL